jgi:hypothetical protein
MSDASTRLRAEHRCSGDAPTDDFDDDLDDGDDRRQVPRHRRCGMYRALLSGHGQARAGVCDGTTASGADMAGSAGAPARKSATAASVSAGRSDWGL